MGDPRVRTKPSARQPSVGRARMNKLSPELMRHVLHPAMHEKLLLRAVELVELGWTRGTAARDTEGQKVRGTAPAGHAQTDAPYVRGRLVIIRLGDGLVTCEVTRRLISGRSGHTRRPSPALPMRVDAAGLLGQHSSNPLRAQPHSRSE